ncbi:phage tail assembly protein [Halopseudomonas phragmitis]|uniref:Phage tail protein n=1 Tax=Halopseudomonas phragmitis TaxID=1931241 RepID=A0A1V0B6B0_9GAMM|nr:phage tail assembly protein [Halopseudomonas phragmitis]AQZ95455.1 phage tail protein [Halopseudomonas phragmitis]
MSKADKPEATAQAEQTSKNPNEEIITLDQPIKRGETEITSITLRKPVSGELRGTSLMDLAHMDVIALRKVLPRISQPTLTDIEVGNLDPADLMQCGVAVASFLLTKKAREGSLEA